MFTGIIKYLGKIHNKTNNFLSVKIKEEIDSLLKKGDSIAVSGVCLTLRNDIINTKNVILDFDVSETTTGKTNYKLLKVNSFVNIEFPLRAHDFISGHIVSGHVEGTVKIVNIIKKDKFYNFYLEYDSSFEKKIFNECSVAVEGISLTVANIDYDKKIFYISVIPETFNRTNLQFKKTGNYLNIETDYLLKKVNENKKNKSNINYEMLGEKGFL